ncbi:RluA family pseudouridine synthase [Paenibacillus mesotrionivorans]|uniref:RluA family pseudouridine synthase n=1 Tax=Paenibacillus mesotrionivorans TaxID=3160968 RepID=A0ACC7P460_9BACL
MANKRNSENGRRSGSSSHKQQSDKNRPARRGAERHQQEGRGKRQRQAAPGSAYGSTDYRGGSQAPAGAAQGRSAPESEGQRDPRVGRRDGRRGPSAAGAGYDRRRGPSPASAGQGSPRRPEAGENTGALSLSGRRKGEWYEIRLPDQYGTAPASAMLRFLPLPPKMASKFLQDNAIQKSGNLLKLRLFPKERLGMEPDWHDLNILFEDDFLLIVNKPMGMEVHPSAHGQKGTLANAVAAYYEMTGKTCKVRPVHRLDKDTTGPVIFAKNELASVILEKSLKDKKIERLYVAVAEGRIIQQKGTIDAPIGQDRLHSTRRRVSETGEPAVTHYDVVERLKGHTLVRLRLGTGRTHQIRVHLSHIGHPIAGDGMYGGKRTHIDRQALHGEKLICYHPWTGNKIHVTAPMPEDMAQAVSGLRNRKS